MDSQALPCPFLHKLPAEIRVQIYGYLLQYRLPIKLRQIVPGSRDLSLLRTNRQIYSEALSVLYDLNHIVVTRNDFCRNTEDRLKTPLQRDHVRHLLIKTFSQSIACTLSGPEGRCDVCQPSAIGLINTLASMPRLKYVLIDFARFWGEFHKLKAALAREESGLVLEAMNTDMEHQHYMLKGPRLDHLGIDLVNQYAYGWGP
jgi:hypothetical protein